MIKIISILILLSVTSVTTIQAGQIFGCFSPIKNLLAKLKVDLKNITFQREVKAYKWGNAPDLLSKGPSPSYSEEFYLTEHFLEMLEDQLGKAYSPQEAEALISKLKSATTEQAGGAEQAELVSYSYYGKDRTQAEQDNLFREVLAKLYKNNFPSLSLFRKHLRRGSGRTHILKNKVSERKGSGTNRFFSFINGLFNIKRYRQNGLYPLDEALVEFIIYKIFKSLQMPIVNHSKLILMPKKLYNQLFGLNALEGLKKKSFLKMPVQLERDFVLRESHILPQLTPEIFDDYYRNYGLKLAANFILRNAGHGAVNFENIASEGRILDLGHTGPGFPVMDSVYRCLSKTCEGELGSPEDGSFLGFLDHYKGASFFGAATQSYSAFRLSGEKGKIDLIRDVINSLLSIITDGKHTGNFKGFDSKEDLDLLKTLFSGKIRLHYRGEKKLGSHVPNARPARFHLDQKVYVSTKLMIQLADIKNTKGDQVLKKVYKKLKPTLLEQKDIEKVKLLVNFFAKNINDITEKQRSLLYQEHYPRYEIERKVQQAIQGVQTYEELIIESQRVIEELSQPLIRNQADLISYLLS